MEKMILIVCCLLSFGISNAQNTENTVNKLTKFKKYKSLVKYCENIKNIKSENTFLKCANAYDILKKRDQALKYYNKGLKKFPKSKKIHYHKAISLANDKQTTKALSVFESLIKLDPDNPDIHNSIGRTTYRKYRIPSLMALVKSMILAYGDNRYNSNIKYINELFSRKVSGKSTYADKMQLSSNKRLEKMDDFSKVEFYLTVENSMIGEDFGEVWKLKLKLDHLAKYLKKYKGNSNFFWNYYAAYFIDMKEKGLTETAAHIILSSKSEESKKWLTENQEKLYKFRKWDECEL